jgi:AcrR family transcriptional regulator
VAAQSPRQDETMRNRLLRAGRELLLEDGLRIVKQGLTIPMVVKRVPTTDTTFETHFRKEKYVDELLSSLVTESPRSTQAELVQRINDLMVKRKGDVRLAIRDLCKWDFEQVQSDPATLFRYFIAVFGRNHHGAIRAVRDEYKQVTDYGKSAYEQVLSHWGASLRKPFTSESIAILFTAIVEGLVIRWLLDPAAVSGELFGDAIVAFAGAVVDMNQHQEHIDDVIAPLADEMMREFRLSRREKAVDNPRQVITEAAKAEFAQRGFFATELTHIATTAGVELRTLKLLFPHKVDLVIGGLKPPFEKLRASVADNLAFELSVTEILEGFLKDLAALFVENRAMADALLAVLTHDVVHSPETVEHLKGGLDFPSLIAPIIETGQQAGVFSLTMAAPEVAAMLVNNLLLRCVTRRDCTVDEVVSEVGAVLLNGLLAPK